MNSLYAVMASLPYLKWGDRPPMDFPQFEQWVSNSLSQRILEGLHALRESASSQAAGLPGSGMFAIWRHFDWQFRTALAWERRKRLGWEDSPELATPAIDQPNADLQYQARLALDHADPLECERAIELVRWSFLDNAAAGHYFDIEALVCWWLKLGILWRLDSFRDLEGEATFHRFHVAISDSIKEYFRKEVTQ